MNILLRSIAISLSSLRGDIQIHAATLNIESTLSIQAPIQTEWYHDPELSQPQP